MVVRGQSNRHIWGDSPPVPQAVPVLIVGVHAGWTAAASACPDLLVKSTLDRGGANGVYSGMRGIARKDPRHDMAQAPL